MKQFTVLLSIGLIVSVIFFIDRYWRSQQEEAEIFKSELPLLKEIPSNGDGVLKIEHCYFRASEHKSQFYRFETPDSICKYRTDYYLVYNYKPSDSLFMFTYIDSLVFDKEVNVNKHVFYLYNPEIAEELGSRRSKKYAHWIVSYEKNAYNDVIIEDYFYIRVFDPGKDEWGNYYHFVYDEKTKKFRQAEDYRDVCYQNKDGEEKYYRVYY